MRSETDYYLEDKSGFNVKIDRAELGSKENLRFKNLENMQIVVSSNIKSFYALNLKNCLVFVGAVAGGSHLTNCENCQIHLATHQVGRIGLIQLRIHKSIDCAFFTLARSSPIIEHCDRVHFGTPRLVYEGQDCDLKEVGLWDGFENKWAEVLDFQWLKEVKNPHWDVETPPVKPIMDL